MRCQSVIINSQKLTRPVAPQQASLASSKSTVFPPCTSSCAAKVPVIPLPTTTTSAELGKLSVVRWPSSVSAGSLCQNDLVLSGVGRPAWPFCRCIAVIFFFSVLFQMCPNRFVAFFFVFNFGTAKRLVPARKAGVSVRGI